MLYYHQECLLFFSAISQLCATGLVGYYSKQLEQSSACFILWFSTEIQPTSTLITIQACCKKELVGTKIYQPKCQGYLKKLMVLILEFWSFFSLKRSGELETKSDKTRIFVISDQTKGLFCFSSGVLWFDEKFLLPFFGLLMGRHRIHMTNMNSAPNPLSTVYATKRRRRSNKRQVCYCSCY